MRQPRRWRRRGRVAIWRTAWAYLILIFSFWMCLRFAGDRTTFGTILLFGPLWVTTLPAMALAPVALVLDRRSLFPLALAVWIALIPVMGFCVPWATAIHRPGNGHHVRVLTCNVNVQNFDEGLFDQLVNEKKPDIVLLQEYSYFWSPPVLHHGQWYSHREQELVIESRFPIEKAEFFTRPEWINYGGNATRYALAAPMGTIHVMNLHLASPHLAFQAMIDGKPSATQQLENHLKARNDESQWYSGLAGECGGSVIIGGDFNSRCESSIYRRWWSGFSDAYATSEWGFGKTYYASGADVRIDHVLSGSDWRCVHCEVGPSIGSPHMPVIADLEWIGGR
jgi:endonuclease/exonuclease/phosphatase (EEP) superfamily protein YafD